MEKTDEKKTELKEIVCAVNKAMQNMCLYRKG